jgi:DNA segregation ATPase FtsK/SpoIIIE-like protein
VIFDSGKIFRFQSPFISESEIEKIIKNVKTLEIENEEEEAEIEEAISILKSFQN